MTTVLGASGDSATPPKQQLAQSQEFIARTIRQVRRSAIASALIAILAANAAWWIHAVGGRFLFVAICPAIFAVMNALVARYFWSRFILHDRMYVRLSILACLEPSFTALRLADVATKTGEVMHRRVSPESIQDHLDVLVDAKLVERFGSPSIPEVFDPVYYRMTALGRDRFARAFEAWYGIGANSLAEEAIKYGP